MFQYISICKQLIKITEKEFGSLIAPTVSVFLQAVECSHMGMQRGSGDKGPSQIVAIS